MDRNEKNLLNFKKMLVGKTIVDVNWLDDKEFEALGWHSRPVVIELSDGSVIVPQRDDEGNDGGSLIYADKNDSHIIFTTN